MSKVDKIKEKISLLKFWLGICVLLIISDSTWLINNFGKYNFLFILGIIFLLILFTALVKLSQKINKYINELEEL